MSQALLWTREINFGVSVKIRTYNKFLVSFFYIERTAFVSFMRRGIIDYDSYHIADNLHCVTCAGCLSIILACFCHFKVTKILNNAPAYFWVEAWNSCKVLDCLEILLFRLRFASGQVSISLFIFIHFTFLWNHFLPLFLSHLFLEYIFTIQYSLPLVENFNKYIKKKYTYLNLKYLLFVTSSWQKKAKNNEITELNGSRF